MELPEHFAFLHDGFFGSSASQHLIRSLCFSIQRKELLNMYRDMILYSFRQRLVLILCESNMFSFPIHEADDEAYLV